MYARPRLAMSAVFLLLFGACSPAPLPITDGAPSPADMDSFWPRFHGPVGDNISTDSGLLKRWPEGGPKLIWAVEGMGHGFSGVAIADGWLYTSGNIDDRTVITALDLDGRVRWQSENGDAWTGGHPGTRGTPTVDGDRLYHESPLGEIVCLDAKSGERVWGLNILEEFGGRNLRWGLAESLLVDGHHVICCPFGGKGSVVALDKATGQTVWAARSTGDSAGYASPTLCEHEGLRMILTMSSKALVGVNADTGDLLFRFEHVTDHDVNALMPLYHDGHVFISSGYRSGSVLVKLNVDGEAVSVEKAWESKELDNHHGGVILMEGYLYGACHSANRAKWVCLDWKTGQLLYAERGVGKGSLTSADGMLYTISEKRKVGLVDPSPKKHTVLSQFSIPSGGKGSTWAHPVVCGGCLYIRHGDRLYAYDVRGKP